MVAVEPASPPCAPSPRAGGHAFLITGLAMAVMMLSLLQTLVLPVLRTIAAQLHASNTAVGWVLTANLLAAAVATPVLGRLGDVHGRRPVMLGILLIVLVGTLLALFTSSLPLLILARVLQGTSYGLFPLSMGVLREEVPPDRLTQSMALVSATLGIGGVVGLLATGLLTRGGADYHRPFWFGLAITLLALVICFLTLPRSEPGPGSTSVDWIGAFVLGAGLILLLLPISQGETWGWGTGRTIGLFIAAVVVLGLWIPVERRIPQPLASPHLFANRGVMLANGAGLLVGFGLYSAFLGIIDYVETPAAAGYGFGASVLRASALYLLPGGVAGVLAAPFIGQFVHRVGANRALSVGALFGVVGFAGMAVAHSQSWAMVVFGAFSQLAVTFGFATLPALLVQAVPPSQTGVANSVNSIMRSLGSALASALALSLLTGMVQDATGVPTESAYTLIFALGGVAFAVVAVIGLVGAGHGGKAAPTDEEEEREEAALGLAGEFSPVSGLSG